MLVLTYLQIANGRYAGIGGTEMSIVKTFGLIKEDIYIKIKGSFKINKKYNHQKEKLEKFREKHKHKLFYWDDIVEHCKLPFKTYNSYLRRARKLKISEEDYLANMMYLKNI